ncbi:MAG: prolipoprotein diacylglyceryl transferase, partial [Planctomycetaceae bacterium]|nr:prolipoprotein diacylglyceryl transferase [Planctomycetaceae bacterium]
MLGLIEHINWDPVIFKVGGPLALRWYGLMYVVGFVLAQHILKRFCRAGFLPMNEQQVADFILWQVLGVILGGRLGYMFFYRPDFLKDPQELVRVWEGGLSFHGGLLGVCAVFVWFARRHKVPVLRLGDASAMAVVPGIFAVRVANFINGELYGRITDGSVPWAMRFPTDPVAQRLLGVEAAGIRERELKTLQAIGDGTWAKVMDRVPLRHPSQ